MCKDSPYLQNYETMLKIYSVLLTFKSLLNKCVKIKRDGEIVR